MKTQQPNREALIARYQELLMAKASVSALDAAINLVERLLSIRIPDQETEQALAALHEQENTDATVKAHLSEDLLEFSRSSFDEASLKRARRREAIQRRHRVTRSIRALALPEMLEGHSLVSDADTFSFMMDALLVVFHHAHFALLPKLEDSDERLLLLHWFTRFAKSLPSQSEQNRIMALVYDEMGDKLQASYFYNQVVLTTPSDSHEFMTVLQQAWTYLLESSEVEHAMNLLLRHASKVPEDAVAEFNELVATTADEARRR